MAKKELISEYKAAALTAMSPTLLRWLTSHAPKHGSKRKLKVAHIDKETYFFDKEEVIEFNSWLKNPWSRNVSRRPHMPAGIRREIKEEANGACAICQSHKDTCEAAHLDPIAKSENNHPENLLWLYANHHTAYDTGCFGPDEENREFVTSFKQVLRRYRVMLWRIQDEVSHKLFVVLGNCDGLKRQLDAAKTKEQVEIVEKIATETLAVLPALAPLSKADPNYAVYETISADAMALKKSKSNIAARLRKAQRIRKDYVAAFGFVMCPLCKGSGRHEGTDCPVCCGDQELEQRFADIVDVRAYEQVECPVCEGEGSLAGEPCPACGGDARIARRDADSIDLRDYEEVDCPLCDGEGRYARDDCPACGGEARLTRRDADSIDLRDYEEVDCPLCDGEGRYARDDCPACGGEAQMARRDASNSRYLRDSRGIRGLGG